MENGKQVLRDFKDASKYVSGENLEKLLDLTFNELFYFCESKNGKTYDNKPFWLLNAFYKYVRLIDNNSKGINKNQVLINLTKELFVNGYIFFGAKNIKRAFKESSSIRKIKVA